MTKNEIIAATKAHVQKALATAEGGHDWFHIERVWRLAKNLAAHENVNLLVVELGALLHDIADSKFHGGNEEIGPRKAQEFLQTLAISENHREAVVQIVRHISFKGGEKSPYQSPEFNVVQDADRLDALGAIGIARTFNYGGYKGNLLYNPAINPHPGQSKEEYKKGNSPTINHFYEKLLLLKDRMNTAAGRAEAEKRHAFMEVFLERFYSEWRGEI